MRIGSPGTHIQRPPICCALTEEPCLTVPGCMGSPGAVEPWQRKATPQNLWPCTQIMRWPFAEKAPASILRALAQNSCLQALHAETETYFFTVLGVLSTAAAFPAAGAAASPAAFSPLSSPLSSPPSSSPSVVAFSETAKYR
jgi:hypothetical protein